MEATAEAPRLEILPEMVIYGWLCGDCTSCDRHGVCHQDRMYVGRWSQACRRLRPKKVEGGDDDI